MYKLTIRLNWMPLVALIAAGAGAVFLDRQFTGMIGMLPMWAFGSILFMVAIVANMIIFGSKANMTQVFKVTLSCLAISALLGAIGALVNSNLTLIPDTMMVLVSWVQLAVMCVGGVIVNAALYKMVPTGAVEAPIEAKAPRVEAPAPVEATKSAPSQAPTPAPAPAATTTPGGSASATGLKGQLEGQKASSSATNLKGILDKLSPDEELKPSPAPEPIKSVSSPAPAPAAAAEAPASTPATASPTTSTTSATPVTSEPAKPATSTATRLQAQKRKSTSTFTKLQALSASGTGTIRQKPVEATEESADSGLKSILDRLDTGKYEHKEEYTDEVAMDSLFHPESLLAPTEVFEPPASAKSEPSPMAAPVVKPEPPKPAAVETPKQPEAQVPPLSAKPPESPKTFSSPPRPTGTTPVPDRPAEPVKPAAKPAEPVKPRSSDEAPSLAAMLDAMEPKDDAPAKSTPVERVAKALDKPLTPAPNTTPAAKPSEAKTSATKLPPPSIIPAQPDVTDKTVEVKKPDTDNTVETLKPVEVDKTVEVKKPDIEKISEAPKPIEVDKTVEVKKPEPPALDKTVEVKKPEPPAVDKTVEVKKPEPPAPAKSEGLFGGGVDSDIDDIFSNLVSPDALKEAAPRLTEAKAPAAEESLEKTVETSAIVDTAKTAAEPAAPKVQDKVEPKEQAKSDGMFESGVVDKELDDIFSALVPAEAQREVKAPGAASAKPAMSAADELALLDAAPDEVSAAPTEQAPVVPQAKAEPPKVEASKTEPAKAEPAAKKDGLFETGIDQDLDDIFSNLVPAEAQREVADKPIVKEEPKPEPKVEPKAAEPVRETKAEPKPEPKPEPVAEAKSDKQDGLFGGGLDQELDDIFSSLAPSEALRDVSDATLAKYRDDAPESKSGQDLSFAPPKESQPDAKAAQAEAEKAEAEKAEAARAEAAKEAEAARLDAANKAEAARKAVEEIVKPGKFNETLSTLPAIKNTVEGLLQNLAEAAAAEAEAEAAKGAAESGSESFAPPGAQGSFAPPGEQKQSTKNTAADLMADLAAENTDAAPPQQEAARKEAEPEPIEAAPESQAADEQADDNAAVAEPAKAEEEQPQTVATAGSATADLEDTIPPTADAQPAEQAASPQEDETAPESETAGEDDDVPFSMRSTVDVASALKEAEKAKQQAKEVKEFGRLSAKSAKQPSTSDMGTMKTIGKLLIEVQAVENIIKQGEKGPIGSGLSTARIISADRGAGINSLLNKIDSYPGVRGSVIVGHDGLVIASTLGPDMDKDTLGALSLACLGTSNMATQKLEIGKLKQMVLITEHKTTVLTDVEVGILSVFLEESAVEKIDGLLNAIHETIHG